MNTVAVKRRKMRLQRRKENPGEYTHLGFAHPVMNKNMSRVFK